MCGTIAGTLDNIGAMMALGTFAGIINVLYFRYVHLKINRNRVFDTYGVLYIFIVSLLSTFFINPIVLIGMYDNTVYSNLLNNIFVTSFETAGWSLTYMGISIAIALVSGLFVGLVLKCFGK